jgi:hypothetical protein
MTYLAVFEDQSGSIDRDVLRAALARDWSGTVTVAERPSGPESDAWDVEWSYASEEGKLDGHSHVDGTCIYLDGPLNLAARFAVWYRSLVREDIEVIFCDESYSFDGVVSPGSTVEDVMDIASV